MASWTMAQAILRWRRFAPHRWRARKRWERRVTAFGEDDPLTLQARDLWVRINQATFLGAPMPMTYHLMEIIRETGMPPSEVAREWSRDRWFMP